MKMLGKCAALALAALALTPVMAQQPGQGTTPAQNGTQSAALSPEHAKAVELAAPDSKATITEISYAVYLAVKANPANADKVYADVLAQREDWTAGEVYAILRAVMMAHPDLYAPLYEHADEGEEGEEPAAGGASTPKTMMDKLVLVLNSAKLRSGTAQAVLDAAGLPGGSTAAPGGTASGESDLVPNDMAQISQEVLSGSMGGATGGEEIKEPIPVTPTPEPMSPVK